MDIQNVVYIIAGVFIGLGTYGIILYTRQTAKRIEQQAEKRINLEKEILLLLRHKTHIQNS